MLFLDALGIWLRLEDVVFAVLAFDGIFLMRAIFNVVQARNVQAVAVPQEENQKLVVGSEDEESKPRVVRKDLFEAKINQASTLSGDKLSCISLGCSRRQPPQEAGDVNESYKHRSRNIF